MAEVTVSCGNGRRHYKTDFAVTLRLVQDGSQVSWPTDMDFTVTFKGGAYRQFVCSRIDGEYKHCKTNSDGSLTCYVDNHGLGLGEVTCEIAFSDEDSNYADGERREVAEVLTGIVLARDVTNMDDCVLDITVSNATSEAVAAANTATAAADAANDATAEVLAVVNDANAALQTANEASAIASAYSSEITTINSDIDSIEESVTDLEGRVTDLEVAVLFTISADELTLNHLLRYGNGVYESHVEEGLSFYATEGYHAVPSGTDFTLRINSTRAGSGTDGLAFYDSNKEYISGVQHVGGSYTYEGTTPDDCAYIRFTSYDAVDAAFCVATDDAFSSIEGRVTDLEDAAELENFNLMSMYSRIGVIGDSLSSGELDGHADNYDISWLSTIARLFGQEARHFSSGGQTARSWLSSKYYTNIVDEDYFCECYFVALGTNDANTSYGVELGTVDDIGTDNDTFYANYYKIINRIKEANPYAQIFLLSRYDGTLTDEFTVAIKYFADTEDNCFFMDITGLRGGWTPGLYKEDGTTGYHCNALGYARLGYFIAQKAHDIILENPVAFSTVGTY